jgi:hypothetical protein
MTDVNEECLKKSEGRNPNVEGKRKNQIQKGRAPRDDALDESIIIGGGCRACQEAESARGKGVRQVAGSVLTRQHGPDPGGIIPPARRGEHDRSTF